MGVKEASATYLGAGDAAPTDDGVSAGFKRTEVGVIPEDWLLKQAGSLGVFRGGNGFPLAFQGQKEGAYPFFKVSDMSNTGNERELIQANHYISKVVRDRLRAFVFPTNTIVFAKIGAAIFLERKKRLGQPSCIDNNLAGFMLQDAGGSIGYLSYFFQSFRLGGLVSATALPSLSGKVLGAIQIPLPSTKLEQDTIAEVLSDADALIESLQQLIAKKRALKQGAMQALLTGNIRLPGFDSDWQLVQLGDIASFYKGKGLPKSAITPDGAAPCVHYGELFTRLPETILEVISRTDAAEGCLLSEVNDVLMPTSDVTPTGLAKASSLQIEGVVIGGDVLVIRSPQSILSGSYLSYVIRNSEKQVLELVSGTTVFHLYASDMAKFEFKMPDLVEQQAIVAVLSDMNAEIDVLETRLAKTRDLKAGMMQVLLTGRIRLPLDQAA